MNSIGLTVNLKDDPEAIAAYKEYHRKGWPVVEASLRRVGIERMKIFLIGRRLFMYLGVADNFDPSTYIAQCLQEPRAVSGKI